MEQQSKDTVLPAASAATHPSTPAPTEPPRRPAPAGRSAAVDGIRGIGVMTVLLYHAGVTSLAGAFLDMDMFFVTSGMLITMLLLREYKRRGRLPLLGFWLGRARRLLPGLFAVLTVVGLHGYFLADPTTLTALRQDMLSTLGFFANWHFINDDATYFTAQSVNSPLIHMWSLAIEEQFYLVWPIFLMLWLKVRRGSVRGLPTVLALLALASAIYMAWLYVPGADPSKVYFNTFARAQSLMIGCIVGIWITRNSQRRIIPAWPAPVGMIALVAMVVMPLAVDSQSAWIYHGGFLAVSVMAALLGASVFTDRQSAVARLTRLRPLPWLGRLTYGLYIWHWPIFVILDEDRTGLPFLPLLALRLGVTILVAHLFDRFVDAPIHAGALSRWKVRTPLKALVAAGTAA